MSDTPETDEIAKSLLYERADKRDHELRQHARRLERERDELNEKLEQVREQYRLASAADKPLQP